MYKALTPLVNAVPLKKFPLLLKKIIQQLTKSSGTAFFDAGEEEQLTAILRVSKKELRLICELCAYIFEQAAYNVQRPDILEKRLLEELEMNVEHAALIRQFWKVEATLYVAALQDRHIVGPRFMKNTTWAMHLTVAESGRRGRRKYPTTIFKLQLVSHNTPKEALANIVNVECSHVELSDFFNQLQTIQANIDLLSP